MKRRMKVLLKKKTKNKMDQDNQKIIDEQLRSLPAPLQRAISLTPWRNIVSDISKKFNLDEKSASNLSTETMIVIYMFEKPSDFLRNIMRELSLDIARATMIASDIDKQVFAPILEKANELQAEAGEGTMQSIPEPVVESTPIASTVVVERHEEISAPATEKPKTTLTFEERKKLVPNIPDNKQHYQGTDPYREQI